MRKTGVVSDGGSPEVPGRVLRGAKMDSSSMLIGKLARLISSIVGIERSFLRSLSTRGGNLSNGLILYTPELPSLAPSLTTWPAIHGKLADSRSRPFDKVLIIAEYEEASEVEKQRQI